MGLSDTASRKNSPKNLIVIPAKAENPFSAKWRARQPVLSKECFAHRAPTCVVSSSRLPDARAEIRSELVASTGIVYTPNGFHGCLCVPHSDSARLW